MTQEQNRPALYSITMTGMHNVGERTVELQISGEEMLPVFDDPRITVYLVEDNVLASKAGWADPVNCEVGNTTWLPLSSLGTVGVAMTTEEANSRIDIYDLSGRNVGNDPQRLTPGIYILTRNNNGNIATEKIIVR